MPTQTPPLVKAPLTVHYGHTIVHCGTVIVHGPLFEVAKGDPDGDAAWAKARMEVAIGARTHGLAIIRQGHTVAVVRQGDMDLPLVSSAIIPR